MTSGSEVARLKKRIAELECERMYAPNEPNASTFIQWKGTDVCMDIDCPKCGASGHICGEFAYAAECIRCGSIWKLGQSVSLVESSREDWKGCEPHKFGDE